MSKIEELYYPSLFETAVAMSSARSSKEIINNLVEKIAKTMRAKGCSLMLLSFDKMRLIHASTYGLSETYLKKGPILADKSISETLDGKILAIYKATEDERIQYPKQAEREGIASILSVPMKLGTEIIGVIRVYTAESRQFTSEDTYFVNAVASLAAIALKNVRYYRATLQDMEKLKQELAEWEETLKDW